MEIPNQKYHPKGKFQIMKNKSCCIFFDTTYKKHLVNALVIPYFHYCSQALSNAASVRVNRIICNVLFSYFYKCLKMYFQSSTSSLEILQQYTVFSHTTTNQLLQTKIIFVRRRQFDYRK